MSGPREWNLDALRHAAWDATQGWSGAKRSMAIHAVGLDRSVGRRDSLDAIAAAHGVSRETVRRARNELLSALDSTDGIEGLCASLRLGPLALARSSVSGQSRALRRLLTMTGRLRHDELLTAWARAGGKPPYSPLPTDTVSMRAWAAEASGLVVSGAGADEAGAVIDVVLPEELDAVSQFLFDVLAGQPGGVDRTVLLELAETQGLKSTTIATALSGHPAVVRLGRATWALRGSGATVPAGRRPAHIPDRRSARPVRPTTFSWDADGSLRIDFSIPRCPSPVVAVPKAVADLVEGRDFAVKPGGKPARISVRNARLWGFGPSVSDLGLSAGCRASVVLNIIAKTAIVTSAEGKERRS